MRIFAIALSGLAAARARLSVAAENTVHMLDRAARDSVYRAREAVTDAAPGGGVRARVVERRPAVLPLPAAPGGEGDEPLFAPNVDAAREAVDMIRAKAAFAAAARLIRGEDERMRRLIDLLDDEAANRRR